LTNGAACDPDDPGEPLEVLFGEPGFGPGVGLGLGNPLSWPPDLLALVREGLSLSPKGLPLAARAIAAAVQERFAQGRGADPSTIVVKFSRADLGDCAPDEFDRVLAFTKRVHALPTAHRPAFSVVLLEAASMLAAHRQSHGFKPSPRCPFCSGVLPAEPRENAS
jgi:hypothetical protein